MPEEVTYATLKFPNSSKTKNLQESCSLKRTDNHEVPELELDGVAENGTGRAESIAEVAENKAVRGRTVSWKVWSLVVFILLSLNLVVLAGLGTLVLMNYQELFSSNRTVYDRQGSITEQLERNITLYMHMYKNVSTEHIIFKNMVENALKELNNFTSKHSECLKQKKNDLTFCSCSVSWIRHGDSGKPHSSKINMNNQKNENRTQLHIRCLPSSVSWMNLNCTPNKTIMKAKNLSNFCILTCAETVT
ncbi:uncharacterized protein LOC120611714 isoform X1 [Pteropus medius]|uniref:uncharacterized protein LOC120611714 isoform X1 n=1 Tax=Pteropus vampyrus TaxID=132908 RepID=UPI00196BB11B|nr:uncharacterized protein LOC120611714 isoform X1 [Pteropus giganteus]